MRFRFDANQEYQLRAIEAVAGLFRGQPRAETRLEFAASTGFRAYRLAGSHRRPWTDAEVDAPDANVYAGQLEAMVLPGWTAEAVIRKVAPQCRLRTH